MCLRDEILVAVRAESCSNVDIRRERQLLVSVEVLTNSFARNIDFGEILSWLSGFLNDNIEEFGDAS